MDFVSSPNVQASQPYNYESLGFDKFLNKMPAAPGVQSTGNSFNFEQMQVSGSLGDEFDVGKIKIDGVNGRIVIYDDNGTPIGLIGKGGLNE